MSSFNRTDPEWQQAYEVIKSFKLDMNLHKSPELVKQVLIDMGDYPSNETEQKSGDFPMPNSGHLLEDAQEWLSSKGKDAADTFVIYGRSDIHRYIVTTDGVVAFSALHGSGCVEQAIKLGFKITNSI